MKTINKLCLVLSLGAALCAVGCSSNNDTSKKLGKEVIAFDSQLDALNQLNNGTVDVAIIDSVMAGYYTSNGELKENLAIADNLSFTTEQYGIAAKKGNVSLMNKINEAMVALKSTKGAELATYFNLTSEVALPDTFTPVDTTDTSFDAVCTSGKLVIGYTVFAPIAYTADGTTYSGNAFTGYDIELAREVVSYINTTYSKNITIEFQEIDWDSKEILLNNGTIDLIWNGLTITDERQENMCISLPYLNNRQVAVILKKDASKYTSVASLKDAVIGVEGGSAGEEVAQGE